MGDCIKFPAEPGAEQDISLRMAERMYLEDGWTFSVRSGRLVAVSVPARGKAATSEEGM